MFQLDGLYFDPLVHLSFWFNFKLFGLDYRWYHIVDIILHSINGLLVFRFVKLYSADDALALLSGLLFVSTFAASDAVLWSSSRVDLFAILFSLATLILFFRYIKEEKRSLYIASIIAYLLALASKGTPVVIPPLLFWLFAKEKKDTQKQYSIFIPFVVIVMGYFILLRWAMAEGNPLLQSGFRMNLYNYSLSLSSLFVPESILPKLNLTYTFFFVCGLLFIFWIIKVSAQTDRVKSIGLLMLFLFLSPVLALGDFKLASLRIFHALLSSPSHRIYLATIGMSIFMSSLLIGFGKIRGMKKYIILAGLLLIGFNIYEVRGRENIWEHGASRFEEAALRLKSLKPSLPENSTIVFINFPQRAGFFDPYIKVYYDLNEVTTITLNVIHLELPEEFEVDLKKNYSGFIMSKGVIYDVSNSIKDLMSIILLYQQQTDDLSREKYREMYKQLAIELNTRYQ